MNNPYGQNNFYGQNMNYNQNTNFNQNMNYNQNMNMNMNTNMYNQNQNSGFNISLNLGGNNMNTNFREPVLTQIAVGKGIDQNEYFQITNCCKQVYLSNLTPLSTNAGKAIKNKLGYEWFVICSPVNDKDYDFSITSVEGGDYLTFSLDSTLFQVIKTSR
jgi:hypothetical protein